MSIQKNSRLTVAAAIVMSSIIVSRITGYLREMLIPVRFGVSKVSDAYNIAFQVPDLMFSLLIGGAISAAIIPVLSGYLELKQEEEGWKAFGTFINIMMIIIVIVSALGMIFTPQLIPLIAFGYKKSKAVDIGLVIKLTRIMFFSVTFLMFAGFCNGILNSYRKFAAAAYGPTVYNLFSVLSIYILSNKNTQDNFGVEKVAYGVLFSAAVYFLFQFSFAIKNMGYYKLKILYRHPGFRKLIKLAVPSLVSSSVMKINLIISAGFATFFPVGSVTAFNMADKTWQMPLGIIAQGMGVAILPALSSKHAAGDFEDFKNTLMKSLRTVLLLSIPAAVGFIILNKPIIRTLFRFSQKVSEINVVTSASILMFFSIALIAQSIATILNRGFFASNDTKSPLYISTSTIIINILLNIMFYKATSIGVTGMALSYSIASSINAVALLYVLNKKSGGLYLDKLSEFLLKIAPAAIIMGIILYSVNILIPVDMLNKSISLTSKLVQVGFLAAEIAVGTFAYFIIVLKLRVSEAVYIRDLLVGKIKSIGSKLRKA